RAKPGHDGVKTESKGSDLSHPHRAHHEGGHVVAHALLLRSRGLMLVGGVAHWLVGWSGMGRVRRFWRVVVLVLMLVVVPEIPAPVFPGFPAVTSPIAVLRRPIRLRTLCLPVELLVRFRSAAPATPPVGSLLVSVLTRL